MNSANADFIAHAHPDCLTCLDTFIADEGAIFAVQVNDGEFPMRQRNLCMLPGNGNRRLPMTGHINEKSCSDAIDSAPYNGFWQFSNGF